MCVREQYMNIAGEHEHWVNWLGLSRSELLFWKKKIKSISKAVSTYKCEKSFYQQTPQGHNSLVIIQKIQNQHEKPVKHLCISKGTVHV